MSNNDIKRVLDAHSVPYYEHGEHLFADCMNCDNDDYIEVTSWSKRKLYAWLGY